MQCVDGEGRSAGLAAELFVRYRKYREEGRTIYYLDETWLNAGDCVDKLWVDKTIQSKHDAFNKGLTTGVTDPTAKGKRLIVFHIGSHKGFLDGGQLCFE